MMGMGLGSIIFSPTAILWGKRPVYLFGAVLFMATSIWCAVSPNFTSLILARIFQGVAVSPVECLPSATIAEIYFLHERAFRIGIYTLLLLGGKNLVPLVSAVIIQSLGWRWVFWYVPSPNQLFDLPNIPLGLSLSLSPFVVSSCFSLCQRPSGTALLFRESQGSHSQDRDSSAGSRLSKLFRKRHSSQPEHHQWITLPRAQLHQKLAQRLSMLYLRRMLRQSPQRKPSRSQSLIPEQVLATKVLPTAALRRQKSIP
jgi:MFS family permease